MIPGEAESIRCGACCEIGRRSFGDVAPMELPIGRSVIVRVEATEIE